MSMVHKFVRSLHEIPFFSVICKDFVMLKPFFGLKTLEILCVFFDGQWLLFL